MKKPPGRATRGQKVPVARSEPRMAIVDYWIVTFTYWEMEICLVWSWDAPWK